jgi:hypothetical protein
MPAQAATPQHAGNTDEIHLFSAPDDLLEGYRNRAKIASEQEASREPQQPPPSGQAVGIPDHEPPSYDDIVATTGSPTWQQAFRMVQEVASDPQPPRARPARRALSATDTDAVMARMLATGIIQHTSHQDQLAQPQQHTITLQLNDMLSSLTAKQIASNIIVLSLITYMTMVIVHYLFLYTMEI